MAGKNAQGPKTKKPGIELGFSEKKKTPGLGGGPPGDKAQAETLGYIWNPRLGIRGPFLPGKKKLPGTGKKRGQGKKTGGGTLYFGGQRGRGGERGAEI